MPSKFLMVAVAVLVGTGSPSLVWAANGPQKCQQAIGRASAIFFAKRVNVLRRCEKQKVQGKLSPDVDCTFDQPMAEVLDDLATKLSKVIGKACGGADKTCGTPDDVSLADAGWSGVTQCPDFEGSGCTGAIASCADIATCVACVGAAASEQASELVADAFDDAEFGSKSDVNECQAALVKASSGFLAISTLANAACWEARLRGKHDNECPEPGDGRTAGSIAKAETQKRKLICKACGGVDQDCGTVDDLTPAQIGFDTTCPGVTPPSSGSCGGAILDLQDVVACIDCVDTFKAECVTRLAVPGVATYPPECAGPTTTTTTLTSTTITPSSTTTTTTTGGGACGNGVLDPGEQCDPGGSPGGGFGCPPGDSCSGACVCEPIGPPTTCNGSTSTTTSVTTTTTPGPACGNGILDPGEECDMSSPSGSFVCPPGCTCDAATCKCVPISTTTTTTPGGACGNGVLDPGEQCDPGSAGGAFACPGGAPCSQSCTCPTPTTSTTGPPVSSTTSTNVPQTTTSSAPAVSTTTSTAVVTTTTQPGSTLPSFLEFTAVAGTGTCGHAYSDDSEENQLAPLGCGVLNVGGGGATAPEVPFPEGWTTRFSLTCDPTGCSLGPVAQQGPGFGCSGAGCMLGPPLPVKNGDLSLCVAQSFAASPDGIVDLNTGSIDATIELTANVVLTGNATQPCPLCRSGSVSGGPCAGTPESPCTGVCQGSANQNATCTSTNGSGLSADCAPPAATAQTSVCFGGTNNGNTCTQTSDCGTGTCAFFVASLPIELDALTTDESDLSDPDGLLCDDQVSAGCFGHANCQAALETGAASGSLLPIGTDHATTLASVFCIPSTGTLAVDSAAALPGPGALALTGTVRVLP